MSEKFCQKCGYEYTEENSLYSPLAGETEESILKELKKYHLLASPECKKEN